MPWEALAHLRIAHRLMSRFDAKSTMVHGRVALSPENGSAVHCITSHLHPLFFTHACAPDEADVEKFNVPIEAWLSLAQVK